MNEKGITVLSLFDGMSCGQIALREAGIKVNKYFASEIDKHAIKQTQHNFPDTVQLGSVTGVRAADLPPIDLLIGGSPCQGFSFAGKQLNFNDPRSVLFFEYVRILREIQEYNPGVLFLLENVRMRRECEQVITEQLGLEPVVINSALVSAQNRVRLYWTNIRTREEANLFDTKVFTNIPQPEDRGIFLRDVLESEVPARYYLSTKRVRELTALKEAQMKGDRARCVAVRGRLNHQTGKNEQTAEFRQDDKTNCLTSVEKDNLICEVEQPTSANKTKELDIQPGTLRTHKVDGGFRPIKSGKAGCLCARARNDGSGQGVLKIGNTFRRLTPTESARLQTVPDWYKWICSETQTYQMLGNGWTVEVIKHIFQFINTEKL